MAQRRARSDRREQRAESKQPSRPSRTSSKLLAAAVAIIAAGAIGAAVVLTQSGDSRGNGASASSAGSSQPLNLSGTDPRTGKQVSLASFRGKPIVLNIWASWCTGCAAEARALAGFERAHREAQIVGIDIQDTKAGARAFYRRFGWTHPSIFDPSGALAAQLGLQGLPTTLFLDRQHRIVTRIVGETDLAGFEAGLRKAAG